MTFLRITLAVCTVLVTCTASMFVLEIMLKRFPGAANVINLTAVLFISVLYGCFYMRCGREKSLLPYRQYIAVVLLSFAGQYLGTNSFRFDISMPLYLIFRSGTMVSTMLLSYLIEGIKFGVGQVVTVLSATIGLMMFTLANTKTAGAMRIDALRDSNSFSFFIGISMLIGAMFATAMQGICQKRLFKNVEGTQKTRLTSQAVFYTNFFSLPIYVPLFPGMIPQFREIFMARDEPGFIRDDSPVHPEDEVFSYPFLLIFCVFLQWACQASVTFLISEVSAVSVNMVTTLRKVISLMLSVVIFRHTMTSSHWIGALLVIAGAFCYSLLGARSASTGTNKPKSDERQAFSRHKLKHSGDDNNNLYNGGEGQMMNGGHTLPVDENENKMIPEIVVESPAYSTAKVISTDDLLVSKRRLDTTYSTPVSSDRSSRSSLRRPVTDLNDRENAQSVGETDVTSAGVIIGGQRISLGGTMFATDSPWNSHADAAKSEQPPDVKEEQLSRDSSWNTIVDPEDGRIASNTETYHEILRHVEHQREIEVQRKHALARVQSQIQSKRDALLHSTDGGTSPPPRFSRTSEDFLLPDNNELQNGDGQFPRKPMRKMPVRRAASADVPNAAPSPIVTVSPQSSLLSSTESLLYDSPSPSLLNQSGSNVSSPGGPRSGVLPSRRKSSVRFNLPPPLPREEPRFRIGPGH